MAAKYIFFSQKTGKYARITYSISENESDLLIMGSSHAIRHFIPEIFEKKLNITCYNSGVQGQKIIFHTALQRMILKRYTPKTIILNIDPEWMYTSDEAYETLADFYPYYWNNRDELHSILSIKSEFIDFPLMLNSYQMNSTIVHAARYFFVPQNDDKGYLPLYEKMDKNKISKTDINTKNKTAEQGSVFDLNFITAFEEFIKNAKKNNIGLYFVISPWVNRDDLVTEPSMKKMISIADQYTIKILDYSKNKLFLNKFELFYDPGHLNNDGAVLFSNLIAEELIKETDSSHTKTSN
ncbi:MAG: hypothetical protein JW904_02675 [Spirochaetales bacterium]|nr:hypothetical protein [Spirochaetales bacterium]